MFENIDFKEGTIIYRHACFDPYLPFDSQCCQENYPFLIVEYDNVYRLEICWNGGENGYFLLTVYQKDTLFLTQLTRNAHLLEHHLQEAIDIITNLLQGAVSNVTSKLQEYVANQTPCIFDPAEIKRFFKKEVVLDKNSGSYTYTVQIDFFINITCTILSKDHFMILEFDCELTKQIFYINIGFENITYIKLVEESYQTNKEGHLLLYKNTSGKPTKQEQPYKTIALKPYLSFITTIE